MMRLQSLMMGLAFGSTLCLASCKKQAQTLPVKSAQAEEAVDQRYVSLPPVGLQPDWTPPKVNQLKLANGLTLWHMERKGAPLVSSHLIIGQGSACLLYTSPSPRDS